MTVPNLFRAIILGLLVAVPTGAPAQQQGSLEQVAAAADPAVGRVLSVLPDGMSTGSGFVLGAATKAGALMFLTNSHVVAGADPIAVVFRDNDTLYVYAGDVVTQSDRLDLALLVLVPVDATKAHNVRPLGIRSDLARKGERVVALGFPGAADSLGVTLKDPDFFTSTLTDGTVSKTLLASWDEGTPDSDRFNIVQHTASINPGNSGGPLLDTCANVVGLNTGAAMESGDGFQPNDTYWAISSTEVAAFLRQNNVAFTEGKDCASKGAGPAAPAGQSEAETLQSPTDPLPEPAAGPPAEPAAAPDTPLPAWVFITSAIGFAVLVTGGIMGIMLWSQTKTATKGGLASGLAGEGSALRLHFGSGARHEVGRRALERGIRIGRAPEADIRIDAPGVSRLHAMLRLDGRHLTLADLGSTNHTHVDGQALVPNRPVRIGSASRIVLGSETLSLTQIVARQGQG